MSAEAPQHSAIATPVDRQRLHDVYAQSPAGEYLAQRVRYDAYRPDAELRPDSDRGHRRVVVVLAFRDDSNVAQFTNEASSFQGIRVNRCSCL